MIACVPDINHALVVDLRVQNFVLVMGYCQPLLHSLVFSFREDCEVLS